MISLGFTKDDYKRVAWTFLEAASAFVAYQVVRGRNVTDKAVVVGAIAAGIAAVKNFVLADGSVLK